MAISGFEIIWSIQAKNSLKEIFEYHSQFSKPAAIRIIESLILAPLKVRFAKQFQVDDINPKYRRIIVADYKILYTTQGDQIFIIDIFCTKKSPEKLRGL